ncbi:MAG: hypothetical protein Q7L07_13135 [Pseudohongiella sp.]|nr:hypothetical protein [Pseudohongiella sp.]
MYSKERIARLEILALNQTLIIEQLSCAISAMMSTEVRAQALDRSAEDLLKLVFTEGVPLAILDLAVDWRQKIARPDIMQTS